MFTAHNRLEDWAAALKEVKLPYWGYIRNSKLSQVIVATQFKFLNSRPKQPHEKASVKGLPKKKNGSSLSVRVGSHFPYIFSCTMQAKYVYVGVGYYTSSSMSLISGRRGPRPAAMRQLVGIVGPTFLLVLLHIFLMR